MNYHVKLTTETLKRYRKYKGLTRDALSQRTGVSSSLLYNLEAGIAPLTTNTEETLRQKLDLTDTKLVKFITLADAIEQQ